MNVAELAAHLLATYPADMPVAITLFSEHCVVDADCMAVETLGETRPDGWIHDSRPDRPSYPYLVFSGN